MSLCVKTPLCPHTALWCWATANACVCSCRYTAASVIDTTSKYKFLWKLPLEEVEVVKSKTQKQNLVVVFFSNFFFFTGFAALFIHWGSLLLSTGSTQATNKESIQKMISRLEEDLSTMGQISKLSETLSFPHLVLDIYSLHVQLSPYWSWAATFVSVWPFSMAFVSP